MVARAPRRSPRRAEGTRLIHLLWTNAPGAGGAGFRRLEVPVALEPPAGRRIESWLRRLVDAAGRRELVAAAPFRIAGALSYGLAVVEPGFTADEHGRAAVLAHALATPAGERAPAAARRREPLAELLTTFRHVAGGEALGTGRLAARLARCRRAGGPNPPAPTDDGVVARRTTVALVRAAVLTPARQAVPGLPATPRDAAAVVVAATTAWPPRLRLAFSWLVGGERPVPGMVTLTAGEVSSPAAAPSDLDRWLDPWMAALEADATRWASDWDLRGWDDVAERAVEVPG